MKPRRRIVYIDESRGLARMGRATETSRTRARIQTWPGTGSGTGTGPGTVLVRGHDTARVRRVLVSVLEGDMRQMATNLFDRIVLTLPWVIGLAAAIGAAFYFGVVLQAGVVVIALALLWIGWELHRIAQLAVNYVRGYEEGVRQRIEEIGFSHYPCEGLRGGLGS